MSSFIRSYEEILATIDTVDVVAYAQTRNHLSGAVSRLSPYLTRGVITLPMVRDRILGRVHAAAATKFIQELAWREYFQRVWWQQGDAIFTDMRAGVRSFAQEKVPLALMRGQTGILTIDQAIDNLYQTGYVHNHARMWIAGLATNLARAHWLPVSRWFYYHLIDGDIASNTLSFQWVAGTLTGKPYDFNQAIINACSPQTQSGTYLDIDRSELLNVPTPMILLEAEQPVLPVNLPTTEAIPDLTGQTVRLFHPFHLDPTWRVGEGVIDVLLIDPTHYERFPVSSRVLDFIIAQARSVLPEVRVHVGTFSSLPGVAQATVYTRAHPTVAALPLTLDQVPQLFPGVVGAYRSFSAFWRACERFI